MSSQRVILFRTDTPEQRRIAWFIQSLRGGASDRALVVRTQADQEFAQRVADEFGVTLEIKVVASEE